jgi:hypothetical protein
VRPAWRRCALWIAAFALSVPVSAGAEPKAALPPLAHQIAAAGSVVLGTTQTAAGTVAYRVEEIWKAAASSPGFKTGQALRLDTRTHELLGHRPANEQKVVLFFLDSGLPADSPLELLPVVDGAVTYSPHDASVREKLTLQELKERVAGLAIALKVSYVGLKSVPVLAVAHNNLAPVLVLFDDHLVQRVIFRKTRKYSEIEFVEVSKTDGYNLDIAYADSAFTFACRLEDPRDLGRVLQFFGRKGVRLGDRARQLLGSP